MAPAIGSRYALVMALQATATETVPTSLFFHHHFPTNKGRARMRDLVTTSLELAGFLCLVLAGFTLSVTLGLAVAGVALIATGYLAGRS